MPPSRHAIYLQLMAHTNRAWDHFHFFRSSEAAASSLHVHDGSDTSHPLMAMAAMAAVPEFAGFSVNSGTVSGSFPSSHVFFESYYVEQ